MPQMSPLSWILLFLMFIFLYLANTIKMYYLKKEQTNTLMKMNNSKPLNKLINWKW